MQSPGWRFIRVFCRPETTHAYWRVRTNARVPHISLVFCEMWDTTGLALKPFRAPPVPLDALALDVKCGFVEVFCAPFF